MTEADALSMLKSAGYKNITVILEESDKEIDKVFAQVPESGTVYAKSSEVVIKISKGIKVPDVTTMKKADAVSMLEGLGFVVNILPDATAAGKVKTQAPAAGTYLNYGSTVTIEIDTSGTTETVPKQQRIRQQALNCYDRVDLDNSKVQSVNKNSLFQGKV